MRLGAKKVDFGSPLAPSWSQNGAQNHPSGAKKGPESIIPRTILRHWKRALKKHNMLAFFTALFPSSFSERSFIQKYYANAFGKPLNQNKKMNPNIQRLNETMTIFSKTSWSTIASTHRPRIHPPRHTNKAPDRHWPGGMRADFYHTD